MSPESKLPVTLVWLRRDLRVDDQPALSAAAERGAVVPVFIWAPEEERDWSPGAASRWWLHGSLAALGQELKRRGSRLIFRHGPSESSLRALVAETGASAVYWNRCYEPAAQRRDARVESALRAAGVEVADFNGSLLFEPRETLNKQGRPYRIFTPFYRACLALPSPERPRAAVRDLPSPRRWPKSLKLDELQLQPRIDWAAGLRAAWSPGAKGAIDRLDDFLQQGLAGYVEGRDRPGVEGVSRLSPHLHYGEISPRRLWHAVCELLATRQGRRRRAAGEAFLRQSLWREFAAHQLFHFPAMPTEPLAAGFAKFLWRNDPRALRAWQRGLTGYPLVDAGMRQLWISGWMHNRVRMIAGSFLVKHLLLPWQAGARWFWDTLVDADLANNAFGWQWVAGCGADAAPYFRIFNPIAQGRRFDAGGRYVRRWVPELSNLPDKWIHEPWAAPPETLAKAGVELGRNYPKPIVEHAAARARALEAFASMRRAAAKENTKRK